MSLQVELCGETLATGVTVMDGLGTTGVSLLGVDTGGDLSHCHWRLDRDGW